MACSPFIAVFQCSPADFDSIIRIIGNLKGIPPFKYFPDSQFLYIVPYADNILVNFEINGNGEIAGVGNGSPTNMSSFQQPRKKTWKGRCLAIIRPKGEAGKIILKASAEMLKEAVTEIVTEN